MSYLNFIFPLSHLEVNMNVISKDVHTEEFAGADFTGVLFVTVCQQMLVHVTPAGEHLCTQTLLMKNRVCRYLTLLLCRRRTLPQMGQGEGSFLYLVPSSPLTSNSSLFMCFGPVQMYHRFNSAKSLKQNTAPFNSSVIQSHVSLNDIPFIKAQLSSSVTHPHRASCDAPASRLYGRTFCCRFHRNIASRHAFSCAWKGCCW